MRIRFVSEVNAFNRFSEENAMSANAYRLWSFLFSEANARRDGEDFPSGLFRVANAGARINMSRAVLAKARAELIAFGLVEYTESVGKCAPQYRIMYLSCAQKDTPKAVSSIRSEGEKIRRELDVTQREGEKDRARAGFTPPSVEEVSQYFVGQGIRSDAQAFLDYYTANGWMTGKVKMSDWRASARMWERREGSASGKPAKTVLAQRYDQRPITTEEANAYTNALLAEVQAAREEVS